MKDNLEAVYVHNNSHFYRNKILSVFVLLSEDVEVCLKHCIENVINYQLLSIIINWVSIFSACSRLSAEGEESPILLYPSFSGVFSCSSSYMLRPGLIIQKEYKFLHNCYSLDNNCSLSMLLSKQCLAILFSNFSKCLFLKDLSLAKKQEKSKMELLKYTSRPRRYHKHLILLRIWVFLTIILSLVFIKSHCYYMIFWD